MKPIRHPYYNFVDCTARCGHSNEFCIPTYSAWWYFHDKTPMLWAWCPACVDSITPLELLAETKL